MSIRKGVLCFVIHEGYVGSVKSYYFVCKYAAVPAQLEIVVLEDTGCCVLIGWAFVYKKFNCFCQFLKDNFA